MALSHFLCVTFNPAVRLRVPRGGGLCAAARLSVHSRVRGILSSRVRGCFLLTP